MQKHTNRYTSDKGKKVWEELESVTRFGYSTSTIFSDWLEFILNALLSLSDNMRRHDFNEFKKRLEQNNFDGIYEERYKEIVSRYRNEGEIGKREIDHFVKAWALLFAETQEKQEDIIGQIFMERITYGENGQYYTPTPIVQMINAIVSAEDSETVADPCGCGSGRFLIEAGNKNPNAFLVGNDIDARCVKMAVINMYLLNLNAKIIQGNALLLESDVIYFVQKGGFVYEVRPERREVEPARTPAQVSLF